MFDVLQKAIDKSGPILRSYFKKQLTISDKSNHQNLVTEADLSSQKAIHNSIIKETKKLGFDPSEIGILGEEDLYIHGTHMFVIDPLDGTTNFASGIPYFSIAIAYYHNNKVRESMVYDPISRTNYYAKYKHGAYVIQDDKKTKLSTTYKPLRNSILSTYISSKASSRAKILSMMTNLSPHVRGVRMFGSSALDYVKVADNSIDCAIYDNNAMWDQAAASLIVKEAGGAFVNWKGNNVVFDLNNSGYVYNAIACHPKLLNSILQYLKK